MAQSALSYKYEIGKGKARITAFWGTADVPGSRISCGVSEINRQALENP